jgi:major membrane immunogen (membrane-anchored lipoprotein)
MKDASRVASVVAATLLLAACGSTQYIMSTKEGRLIVSNGKPELDEKAGTYTYKDSDGRKATIAKGDIVQVMER